MTSNQVRTGFYDAAFGTFVVGFFGSVGYIALKIAGVDL